MEWRNKSYESYHVSGSQDFGGREYAEDEQFSGFRIFKGIVIALPASLVIWVGIFFAVTGLSVPERLRPAYTFLEHALQNERCERPNPVPDARTTEHYDTSIRLGATIAISPAFHKAPSGRT